MRIACCQIEPDVTDPQASAIRAREAISNAIDKQAQIVVLPELCTSGYVFHDAAELRAAAITAGGAQLQTWADEAARNGALVIGGFCELAPDGRIFNSSALVDSTGVLAVYRKLHLWDQEQRWFTPGERPAPVIDTRHGRIGLGICYDIEFPELTRGLALARADLIALPANWPRHPDHDPPILHTLAASTAYLSRVFVAVCDRAGSERGLDFQGGSAIAAPDGSLLATAAAAQTAAETAAVETLIADVDLATARDKRNGPSNDAFADRRPDHYVVTIDT